MLEPLCEPVLVSRCHLLTQKNRVKSRTKLSHRTSLAVQQYKYSNRFFFRKKSEEKIKDGSDEKKEERREIIRKAESRLSFHLNGSEYVTSERKKQKVRKFYANANTVHNGHESFA